MIFKSNKKLIILLKLLFFKHILISWCNINKNNPYILSLEYWYFPTFLHRARYRKEINKF